MHPYLNHVICDKLPKHDLVMNIWYICKFKGYMPNVHPLTARVEDSRGIIYAHHKLPVNLKIIKYFEDYTYIIHYNHNENVDVVWSVNEQKIIYKDIKLV